MVGNHRIRRAGGNELIASLGRHGGCQRGHVCIQGVVEETVGGHRSARSHTQGAAVRSACRDGANHMRGVTAISGVADDARRIPTDPAAPGSREFLVGRLRLPAVPHRHLDRDAVKIVGIHLPHGDDVVGDGRVDVVERNIDRLAVQKAVQILGVPVCSFPFQRPVVRLRPRDGLVALPDAFFPQGRHGAGAGFIRSEINGDRAAFAVRNLRHGRQVRIRGCGLRVRGRRTCRACSRHVSGSRPGGSGLILAGGGGGRSSRDGPGRRGGDRNGGGCLLRSRDDTGSGVRRLCPRGRLPGCSHHRRADGLRRTEFRLTAASEMNNSRERHDQRGEGTSKQFGVFHKRVERVRRGRDKPARSAISKVPPRRFGQFSLFSFPRRPMTAAA